MVTFVALALVLATGSKWSGPINLPESDADIHKFVAEWREKFGAATDIVVVGGGAVGVELSGEIRDEYPVRRAIIHDASRIEIYIGVQDKKITIVHGQDNILNDAYPIKYRNRVKAGLAARNIDLVLGEFVQEFPPSGSGELVFKSEKKLNAGLVVSFCHPASRTNLTDQRQVITSGPKPNTEFIGESLGAEILTETKLVKVEKTLQLSSHPAIFAVGDIIDWKEQKQAAKANGHCPIVVANVLSFLAGQPARKEYEGFPEMIMIINGKVKKSTLPQIRSC